MAFICQSIPVMGTQSLQGNLIGHQGLRTLLRKIYRPPDSVHQSGQFRTQPFQDAALGDANGIRRNTHFGGHIVGRSILGDVLPAGWLKFLRNQSASTINQVGSIFCFVKQVSLLNFWQPFHERRLLRPWTMFLSPLPVTCFVQSDGMQPPAKAFPGVIFEIRQLHHQRRQDILDQIRCIVRIQTVLTRPVKDEWNVRFCKTLPRRFRIDVSGLHPTQQINRRVFHTWPKSRSKRKSRSGHSVPRGKE